MSGRESDAEVSAALRMLAAEARHAEAPAWVEAALVAAFLERAAGARPAWWRLPRWATAGTAGALVVVAAVTLMRRGEPPAVIQEREIATEFIPLVYGYNPGPSESAQVVRVKLRRSSLAALGLPVNPERNAELVSADVVVGEDGVAQAIRLVSSF